MRDVTHMLNAYRECARSLWNSHLRIDRHAFTNEDFDRVDRFWTIREMLFRELVLIPLGKGGFSRGLEETPPRAPIPFLVVSPNAERIPISISRPSPDGNRYWDDAVNWVKSGQTDLRFIEYFDFDDFGYVDFQFYHARIRWIADHPDLAGRDALIDIHHAVVLFDEKSSC